MTVSEPFDLHLLLLSHNAIAIDGTTLSKSLLLARQDVQRLLQNIKKLGRNFIN